MQVLMYHNFSQLNQVHWLNKLLHFFFKKMKIKESKKNVIKYQK